MLTRPYPVALLALFTVSSACSSDPKRAADEGFDPAACGPGWLDACDRARCDPDDPLWTDCRINGWTGYVAPESCAVQTGYPGDDRALCEPSPEDGFQLRFGPKDHSNAADVMRHVVPAGGDSIECVYLPLPNTEERFLGQMVGRVREGVHHTQLRFVGREPTSSSESEFCLPFGGEFLHMGQTPEFQVPDLSVPSASPEKAPAGGLDFEGAAIRLTPGRVLALELHYINPSPDPVLREGWINFYYRDPADVRSVLHGIQLIGANIMVPPRSVGVVRRACEAPSPRTVTHLQGHSHEGATRFSIFVRRAGSGEVERVYESYDPVEPAVLTYSAAIQNAEPDPSARTPGGASGALHLDTGDSLVWECEIDNVLDTPILDGGPNALGYQMCYTFGNFIADGPEGESLWACGAMEEPGF